MSGNVNWQASRNPPLQLNPQVFYGTMATLLQSTGVTFPSAVQGFERDTETPTAYQFSAGIQRNIGWDTVVDAAYVGSRVRNLLQTRNLNLVPYGARFDPANQDPTRPGNPLPDNFFRPYPGYSDVNFFENSGISDYDALQVQVNRRFSRGFQFGLAYTFSHSKDYTSAADTGTGANMRIATYQDPREWNYGLSTFDQTHVAVINYTWDLPKGSSLWDNGVMRAVFDNWQLSGITAFTSGTPSGMTLALQDSGTDLTGGGDGTRVVRQAIPRCRDRTAPLITGSTPARTRGRRAATSAAVTRTTSVCPASTTGTSRCSSGSRSAAGGAICSCAGRSTTCSTTRSSAASTRPPPSPPTAIRPIRCLARSTPAARRG